MKIPSTNNIWGATYICQWLLNSITWLGSILAHISSSKIHKLRRVYSQNTQINILVSNFHFSMPFTSNSCFEFETAASWHNLLAQKSTNEQVSIFNIVLKHFPSVCNIGVIKAVACYGHQTWIVVRLRDHLYAFGLLRSLYGGLEVATAAFRSLVILKHFIADYNLWRQREGRITATLVRS